MAMPVPRPPTKTNAVSTTRVKERSRSSEGKGRKLPNERTVRRRAFQGRKSASKGCIEARGSRPVQVAFVDKKGELGNGTGHEPLPQNGQAAASAGLHLYGQRLRLVA